jgi:hypothetical protein
MAFDLYPELYSTLPELAMPVNVSILWLPIEMREPY